MADETAVLEAPAAPEASAVEPAPPAPIAEEAPSTPATSADVTPSAEAPTTESEPAVDPFVQTKASLDAADDATVRRLLEESPRARAILDEQREQTERTVQDRIAQSQRAWSEQQRAESEFKRLSEMDNADRYLEFEQNPQLGEWYMQAKRAVEEMPIRSAAQQAHMDGMQQAAGVVTLAWLNLPQFSKAPEEMQREIATHVRSGNFEGMMAASQKALEAVIDSDYIPRKDFEQLVEKEARAIVERWQAAGTAPKFDLGGSAPQAALPMTREEIMALPPEKFRELLPQLSSLVAA